MVIPGKSYDQQLPTCRVSCPSMSLWATRECTWRGHRRHGPACYWLHPHPLFADYLSMCPCVVGKFDACSSKVNTSVCIYFLSCVNPWFCWVNAQCCWLYIIYIYMYDVYYIYYIISLVLYGPVTHLTYHNSAQLKGVLRIIRDISNNFANSPMFAAIPSCFLPRTKVFPTW